MMMNVVDRIADRPTRSARAPASSSTTLLLLAVVLGGPLGGCGAGDEHVFDLDGTGTLEGRAFLDVNRDGVPSSGEPSLAGLEVRLVIQGSQDTVASAVSDEEGTFLFQDVRAGTYAVAARGGPMGDSLVVTGVIPSPLEVRAETRRTMTLGLSFPLRSGAAIQASADGVRLYVEGIALNARGTLPDNAIHVWDGQQAIRAEGVGSFGMSAGDSVRILGRTSSSVGRKVLREAQGFRLADLPDPEPVALSTAAAATASAGSLRDALVQVNDAVVSQVQTVPGGVLATVSDGSGSLFVRIPSGHLSAAGIPVLQPGALLAAAGVLLPREGGGAWELHTRSGGDLAVEAAGTISGRAFFDLNGSGNFDASDVGMENVRLELFRQGDQSAPVAVVQSDAQGLFQIGPLEVASYTLEVDPATIPDSLVLRNVQPGVIQVPTDDVVEVSVAISYPAFSVAEARELPAGQTIFIEGVALNARSAMGDNSVHVREGNRAIRSTSVAPPSILAGDRVRFRGRTGRAAGQPNLEEVTPFILQAGGGPGPLILTSAEAATARSGDVDADLVRVREATIVSAHSEQGAWSVRINDGSGEVVGVVRLLTVGWTQQQAEDRLTPGRQITLTGLLIPAGTGSAWRIHPRAGADITLSDP